MSENEFVPRLVITMGEPAGIGPEITVALAHAELPVDLVVAGDPKLLFAAAKALDKPITVVPFEATRERALLGRGVVHNLSTPLRVPSRLGHPNGDNSVYVLETLRMAAAGCISGEFDGMVTAPVSKSVITQSGHWFTGHTEFLAELANVPAVVMMLTAGTLRVALATTHLPLSAVPLSISASGLEQTISILHDDLVRLFGISNPRIAVLGLNPHAGEQGQMGDEEIRFIIPVINLLKQKGMQLVGPLPADTAFVPHRLKDYDAVLAMYHDQGLPVLKYVGFGNAVNITLGLPFIRTSVDHGTAFELAGSGKANPSSIIAATKLAIELAQRRFEHKASQLAQSNLRFEG